MEGSPSFIISWDPLPASLVRTADDGTGHSNPGSEWTIRQFDPDKVGGYLLDHGVRGTDDPINTDEDGVGEPLMAPCGSKLLFVLDHEDGYDGTDVMNPLRQIHILDWGEDPNQTGNTIEERFKDEWYYAGQLKHRWATNGTGINVGLEGRIQALWGSPSDPDTFYMAVRGKVEGEWSDTRVGILRVDLKYPPRNTR